MLCGIFDGHGQWGHYVAKAVRESLPPALLRRWREAVTLAALIDGGEAALRVPADLWRQSYLAACAAVDAELRASRRLDAVHRLHRAVPRQARRPPRRRQRRRLARRPGHRLPRRRGGARLAAVQLTVDFKPNLPRKFAVKHSRRHLPVVYML